MTWRIQPIATKSTISNETAHVNVNVMKKILQKIRAKVRNL